MLLGSRRAILKGRRVLSTGKIPQIKLSKFLLGRAVNPLAIQINEKGDIITSESRLTESLAPDIISEIHK